MQCYFMLFLSLGPALQVYALLVASDSSVWHDCLVPTCREGLGGCGGGWWGGFGGWVSSRSPAPMVPGLFMPPSIVRMERLQIKGISLPRSYPVLLGHVHLSWRCCKSIFPRPLVRLRGTGHQVVVLGMEVEGAGTTCVREPRSW